MGENIQFIKTNEIEQFSWLLMVLRQNSVSFPQVTRCCKVNSILPLCIQFLSFFSCLLCSVLIGLFQVLKPARLLAASRLSVQAVLSALIVPPASAPPPQLSMLILREQITNLKAIITFRFLHCTLCFFFQYFSKVIITCQCFVFISLLDHVLCDTEKLCFTTVSLRPSTW